MAQSKKHDKIREVLKGLRNMSVDELRARLAKESDELMHARFQHATAALENTSELKTKRRLIARIETVLNEKAQRV